MHYLVAAPKITALDPATAGPGDSVGVTGTEFVYVPADSVLTVHVVDGNTNFDIDGKDLAIDLTTHITFKVPLTAADGTYTVTIANRAGTSAGQTLNVSGAACPATAAAAPQIFVLTSSSVQQGATESLRGSGFVNLDSSAAVSLTSGPSVTSLASQNVTATDACHLSFTVPASLAPGTYVLNVKSNAGSSGPAQLTVTGK